MGFLSLVKDIRVPKKRRGASNPVAKNAKKFNKSAVMIDRKKESKKRGVPVCQSDYET